MLNLLQIKLILTLENAAVVVPLNYISSFWSSFEVLFVNCKFKLTLRWKEHFALYLLGAAADNTNENPDNIILSSNKQNCMFLL